MCLVGKWSVGMGAVVCSLSFTMLSAAQEVAPSPAPATPSNGTAASAPDVVRLKNGGLLRGTISELVVGESVTIVTVTGKTREFPMAEVEFAGPADKAPSAAPATSTPPATPTAASAMPARASGEVKPYVVREGQEARLHLTSTPEGLTFHRQTGSAMAIGRGGSAYAEGYERLCTAPCDITVPAGTEVIALSQGNEPPRVAEPVSFPAGESRLVGSFESRAGVRAAGWIILASSVVVGGVMLYSSIDSEQVCGEDYGFGRSCYNETKISLPLMLGGMLIPAVGIPIGIVMGVRRDVAKVEVATRRAPAEPAPVAGITLRTAL